MADSIAIGVAYRDQLIDGGQIENTPIGATTPGAGNFTTINSTGDATLGNAATDKIGFYGVAKVSQAAAITAVSTSAAVSGAYGFTSTQAAALIAAVNSLIAANAAIGITA